jgi:hypothetical protein
MHGVVSLPLSHSPLIPTKHGGDDLAMTASTEGGLEGKNGQHDQVGAPNTCTCSRRAEVEGQARGPSTCTCPRRAAGARCGGGGEGGGAGVIALR